MKTIKLLTTTFLIGAISLVGTANIEVSANSTNDILQEYSVIQSLVVDDEKPQTPIIEQPQAVSTPLTPNGNLTLVDDIVTEDEESKQFITVVSKNGNYFYIIIDRENDKENVYFLNLVDEYDLLQLLGEEFTMPEPELVEVLVEVPIEVEPEVVEEEPEVVEEKGSMLPLLLLLGAGGGGAYYYLNYMKPKDENNDNDFENEFDDDDEEEPDSDEEEDIVID